MDTHLEQVRADLTRAIENDEITLPTLPEVALRVRAVAEDENTDANQLGAVIAQDAALAARIIKVCNSPLLRAREPVDDLPMAISRMGITYASNLAVGLAMEQMFQATSEIIDRRLRTLWQESTQVAGIAHVLARHYTSLRPDQAALAGLTHEIGILPILSYAELDDEFVHDAAVLDKIIEALYPQMGKMILEHWNFPKELTLIPEAHVDLERRTDSADYGDVVTVARLQNFIGTDHACAELDWSTVPAFAALGLDPEPESLVAEDLTEEMAAAKSVFI